MDDVTNKHSPNFKQSGRFKRKINDGNTTKKININARLTQDTSTLQPLGDTTALASVSVYQSNNQNHLVSNNNLTLNNQSLDKPSPNSSDSDKPKPDNSNDGSNNHGNLTQPPSKPRQPKLLKLVYDVIMLALITVDLLLMVVDTILMSSMLQKMVSFVSQADWLLIFNHSLADWLTIYREQQNIISHHAFNIFTEVFTVFLLFELVIRWLIAIVFKHYYRWFFFPFVHWYEVIGCFPQFRALRLLRAISIGRRIYQLGWRFLPEKWLDTAKFYYAIVLEEVSDRVLLTASSNIRTQLTESKNNQALIKKTIDKNRKNIESMVFSMLRTELAPRLREELTPNGYDSPIAKHVGLAVNEAVTKTPEIHRILSLIPIAGGMIESQISTISSQVGYNIANSVTHRLLEDEVLDELFTSIAKGIANIDTENPALESLIGDIIQESLDAFEEQVKIQQWRHHEQMDLPT